MRISVVTAVLNRAATLGECLSSVESQTHRDVEHVLVDGGSTDGSLDLIREAAARCPSLRWSSGPDGGIYDALNKGIAASSGEVVGILGSDDVYADREVLSDVAACFERSGCDACYGDLLYVDAQDPARVRRRWVAARGRFRFGWMPPHTTFFVRRSTYERLGVFDTSFRIAADYELMLRFVHRHRIRVDYVARVLVRMRTGGASNRRMNLLRKTFEDVRAWRHNGLRAGSLSVVLKNLRKVPQMILPS